MAQQFSTTAPRRIAAATLCVLLLVLAPGRGAAQGGGASPPDPVPVWQAPLLAAEVDQAYPLDADDVLVATLRVGGTLFGWSLSDHDLALVDLRSGNVRWRAPRTELASGRLLGVAGTPQLVVVAGTDRRSTAVRFVALDRDTGRPSWRFETAQGTAFAFQPATGRAYLAVRAPDTLRVVALSLADGKSHWELLLPKDSAQTGDQSVGLIPLNEGLLLRGSRLVRIDHAGRPLWDMPLDAGLAGVTSALALGERLLCYGNGALAMLDGAKGEQLWVRAPSDRRIMQFEPAESTLYLREKIAPDRHAAVRLDPADGRVVWDVVLADEPRSPLAARGERVFLTTATEVIALDAASGREAARAGIPAFMHTSGGLPDRIATSGHLLIVAREQGVAAWRTADLGLAYAQAVTGDDPLRFEYASRRYALRQAARSGAPDRITGYVNVVGALRDQIVMQSTGRPAGLTGHVGYGAGFELAAQAANFAVNVVAAGVALRNVAVDEMLATNRMQIVASQRLHEESLQGGYYLRPYHRDGWKVALVRLADGARADVITGATNDGLRVNGGNFPMLAIDAARGRLLASGVGTKAGSEQTYRKFAFGLNVHGSWPGIPPTWTVPYASLFAFDLAAIEFRDYAPGGERAPLRPPSDADHTLRDAILRRNRDAVAEAIKAGADVNAVDEIGFNALFYAAIVDDPPIVRALIDAGANATLRDASGLLAYHYTFMTRGDNRSTDAIRDANLKQGGKTY